VLGDAVNLASRLEGLTKQYGVGMIVGDTTKALVPDVLYRELDRVIVKGKDEPVTIYEPLGVPGQVEQSALDESKLWSQALRQYRSRDWDMAELQLLQLMKANPSRLLYKIFLERIDIYRKSPPPEDWDGAYRFETK